MEVFSQPKCCSWCSEIDSKAVSGTAAALKDGLPASGTRDASIARWTIWMRSKNREKVQLVA